VPDTRSDSATIEATRERNADAVRRHYQCNEDRDLEAWAALWNPNGRSTFPACNFLDPIVGITDLKESTAPKYATRGRVGRRVEILPLTDPTKVLARVRLSIEVAPGEVPFDSEIWVLFTFDEDGLILEHAEMFDTAQYRDIRAQPTTPHLPTNLRPEALAGVG
jgi:ketosteroid isomerase-like protein